jgi:hypothetical protein
MARDLDMLRGVQPLVCGFVVECVTFELIRDFFKLPQVGHRAKRRFIHENPAYRDETVSHAGLFFQLQAPPGVETECVELSIRLFLTLDS